MNKLLSKYIFTGSVVFNVKSMNNIENIKNFDKIKVINNIEDQLKETNLVIKKLSENVFVESLNICDFSKIKNIILDKGRCKIEDGELSYKDFQYLQHKNNIDFYKKNVSNIFKGKSLFFYQIKDYFLQYVQLNFLNTIFNINNGDNIFRKLLNLHLDLSTNKRYLFYDFLDENTSQNFPDLKIENIIKNIDKYLKSKNCIEYSYLSDDFFKKNDKIVVGLTYNHNNIFSIGVVQGLTYCKKNLLFEYLDKTPINSFSDLIIEILNNNVIFNNLKKLDKDLFKNVKNIDKYVFLYQNIKNFIDVNTHEFDHFMYDIYQDIFDYSSKLNPKESMFLGKYNCFYSIFSFHDIADLGKFRDNYRGNFKKIMNKFSIFLDYYSDNDDFKNNFIKNVYKINYLKSFINNNEKSKEISILNDINFYSIYSLEEGKITEFFAEIFSKYIVSNIGNDFTFELLKIRFFYIKLQINNLIKNKKL